jgi:hypothetical protein
MHNMAFELHAARRARLAEILGPRAALILFSPPERLRNGDVHHKFRQDSDILYLTGFEEPGAVVVLRPGHATAPFSMLVRERSSVRTWRFPSTSWTSACPSWWPAPRSCTTTSDAIPRSTSGWRAWCPCCAGASAAARTPR